MRAEDELIMFPRPQVLVPQIDLDPLDLVGRRAGRRNLHLLRASETLFHTGWFVESLVTQTLVLFVIRTSGNPLRSRPSFPLAVSVLLAISVALVLPFSPLASLRGFVSLPPAYFAFLVVVVSTYLLLVEFAKRPIFRRQAL